MTRKKQEIIEAEIVHEPKTRRIKQKTTKIKVKTLKNGNEKRNRKITVVESNLKKKVSKGKARKEMHSTVVIRASFLRAVELSALLGIIIYLMGEMGLMVLLLFILFVLYKLLWGDVEW